MVTGDLASTVKGMNFLVHVLQVSTSSSSPTRNMFFDRNMQKEHGATSGSQGKVSVAKDPQDSRTSLLMSAKRTR